jgi:hypothetical protein
VGGETEEKSLLEPGYARSRLAKKEEIGFFLFEFCRGNS